MSVFNRFCKGQTVRAVLVCLCVILLSVMVSIAAARPRGFGNNPHETGMNNPTGAFVGSGGMKFNHGGLRDAVRPSSGRGGGSGSSGPDVFVNAGGKTFDSSAPGNGGFMSSGGPQATSGSGAVGSGGFGKGHGDKGGRGQSHFNNIFGAKGRDGGYRGNGLIMTRHGSDVVIEMPFGGKGKSTGGKDGFALGCGDAFSKVFSDSDCRGGSFDVPGPTGAKGPSLHHGGQHPNNGDDKPCGGNGNRHWGKGNKGNCGHKDWKCKPKCKPHGHCPHDDDSDMDIDVDTDVDTDIDLDNDTDIDLDNDTDIDLDTDLDNDIDTDDDVIGVPAAPLWLRPEMEFSGCPALMQWLAAETSVSEEQLQIYMANTLATFRDINPCDLCARLQSAALALRDEQGIRISALTAVLEQIAAPGAPISPEQMMQIAQQLAEPEPGSIYEQAAEYLTAAETYVTILRNELGYSTDGSFALAAKYIEGIENTETADYVTARLINLGQ